MKWLQKITIFELLLGFLLLFHLLTNIAWISFNTAPLPWDQAGHTKIALDFAAFFRNFGFLKPFDYLTVTQNYPPLLYTIVSIPILFFGHPILVSELVITIIFLSSLILLYMYAQELFENKTFALLTTFVYSFFPIVFEHSRWLLLESPMVLCTLLLLLLLHRSKQFTNSKYTYAFFIMLGLSLLTKWIIIIYIFFPTLLTFWQFVKSKHYKNEKVVAKIVYASIACLFIALPWYIANIGPLVSFSGEYTQPDGSDPRQLLSFTNALFYSYLFINFQVTIFLSVLFFAGLYLFLRSKNPNKLIICGTMLTIYGGFTFILNKDPRYTLPILPFAAMIIAYFLTRVYQTKPKYGIFLSALVFCYCVLYYFILSFRPADFKPFRISFETPLPETINGFNVLDVSNGLVHAPDSRIWPQKEILGYIDTHRGKNPVTRVLCVIDQERFNPSNFRLTFLTMGLENMEVGAPPTAAFLSNDELKAYINGFDYIILPANTLGVEATRNIDVFKQIKKAVEQEKKNSVQEVWFYPFPGGDGARLYKTLK